MGEVAYDFDDPSFLGAQYVEYIVYIVLKIPYGVLDLESDDLEENGGNPAYDDDDDGGGGDQFAYDLEICDQQETYQILKVLGDFLNYVHDVNWDVHFQSPHVSFVAHFVSHFERKHDGHYVIVVNQIEPVGAQELRAPLLIVQERVLFEFVFQV